MDALAIGQLLYEPVNIYDSVTGILRLSFRPKSPALERLGLQTVHFSSVYT